MSGRDKVNVDLYWESLLLAIIGETIDEEDEICGLVFNKRKQGDRLSIWNRHKDYEDIIMRIGQRFKTALTTGDLLVGMNQIAPSLQLTYDAHESSIQTGYSHNSSQKFTLHSI
jgi:translation initiation factor 4E